MTLSPENETTVKKTIRHPSDIRGEDGFWSGLDDAGLNRLLDEARAEGRKAGRWQGYLEGRDETEASLLGRASTDRTGRPPD